MKFKLGDKVEIVNIDGLTDGMMPHTEAMFRKWGPKLIGATGEITSINDMFPPIDVKLDDESISDGWELSQRGIAFVTEKNIKKVK